MRSPSKSATVTPRRVTRRSSAHPERGRARAARSGSPSHPLGAHPVAVATRRATGRPRPRRTRPRGPRARPRARRATTPRPIGDQAHHVRGEQLGHRRRVAGHRRLDRAHHASQRASGVTRANRDSAPCRSIEARRPEEASPRGMIPGRARPNPAGYVRPGGAAGRGTRRPARRARREAGGGDVRDRDRDDHHRHEGEPVGAEEQRRHQDRGQRAARASPWSSRPCPSPRRRSSADPPTCESAMPPAAPMNRPGNTGPPRKLLSEMP